jgi:hypothetical protein
MCQVRSRSDVREVTSEVVFSDMISQVGDNTPFLHRYSLFLACRNTRRASGRIRWHHLFGGNLPRRSLAVNFYRKARDDGRSMSRD